MEQDIWTQRRSSGAPSRPNDSRNPWQRDRARVMHSAAFRRLQSKTQIMDVGENDFYRTRLTHSLEAAQIGASIVNHLTVTQTESKLTQLLPDSHLIETLCLAHDIGHPPFGHGGETALNFKMIAAGGFEGNGQTLRIVAKLENYHEQYGMDLTRRTLLGLLKYPVLMPNFKTLFPEPWPQHFSRLKPTKAIFQCDSDTLDWILKPLNSSDKALFQQVETLTQPPFQKSLFKSFDASIMELADDIAYGVHDLEDAIALGTLKRSDWQHFMQKRATENNFSATFKKQLETLESKLFSGEHHQRKYAIGAFVNLFITAAKIVEVLPEAQAPLIRYNVGLPEEAEQLLKNLKAIVFEYVIHAPDIQQARYRSQNMLIQLFDAFSTEPQRLLPSSSKARWEQAYQVGQKISEQNGAQAATRVLCDYISGMTDDYAHRMHHKLFGSGLSF